MFSQVRNVIADFLWLRAARLHRSRMGWRDAPRYTRYLEKSRRAFSGVVGDLAKSRAAHFSKHGWSSFSDDSSSALASSILAKMKAEEAAGTAVWDKDGRYMLGDLFMKFPEVEQYFGGPAGDFLRATYGANFKIFYGVCYKSVHSPDGPSGSQLWHADGGPGTCINLMWCLSPVSQANGAMECLSWDDTIQIFAGERRATRAQIANAADRTGRRTAITEYYKAAIEQRFAGKVNQPTGQSGLTFAFSNNTIHKGGFPDAGHERYVCVFHIYPSVAIAPLDTYRVKGVLKTASNPSDPAFGDH